MNGAIFYSGQYGSTAQYAAWISEATGLPAFSIHDKSADPSMYDYLILGSSVIYYKLTIRKWVKRHWARIEKKPTILFTVSGAPGGAKLDGWIEDSLPESLIAPMEHVALQGRLDPNDLSWWTKLIQKIGAWKSSDPKIKHEKVRGFDFMDKSSIEPIVKLVQQFQTNDATTPQGLDPARVTQE